MQAVDILRWVDRVHDGLIVKVIGKRELDEDPVDIVVPVELENESQEIRFGGFGREPVDPADNSGLCGGPLLVADVDLRGRVVADEHHVQTRRSVVRCPEGIGPGLDLRPHFFGKRLAVDQLSHE